MKNILILAFISILLMINVAAIPPNEIIDLEIENTILGEHAQGLEDAPYRLEIAKSEILPVLYPEKLNGSLDFDVDYILGDYSVRVVVVADFVIKTYIGNTEGLSFKDFVLLNESIAEGSNFFDMDEIDHNFAAYDENNNFISPILSYEYFEDHQTNSTVEGSIILYLEQSFHNNWSMEVKYSGHLFYNGDTSFAESLEYRATIVPETLNLESPYQFSLLFILAILIPRKISRRN